MIMASQKYNILYGRLSQEDDRAGESNSIIHQKFLLEKYAQDSGFENTLFLADDGYSGTNFDRPSWKKIIEMIEAGQVETLIVKDMSRLGREYLQVGYYTEIYFPQKGIRFIAVNDGVDSLVESSSSTLSATGRMNSMPRIPAKRFVPSRRCRRSVVNGWAVSLPTATRRKQPTARRLSPTRKLPL